MDGGVDHAKFVGVGAVNDLQQQKTLPLYFAWQDELEIKLRTVTLLQIIQKTARATIQISQNAALGLI